MDREARQWIIQTVIYDSDDARQTLMLLTMF